MRLWNVSFVAPKAATLTVKSSVTVDGDTNGGTTTFVVGNP